MALLYHYVINNPTLKRPQSNISPAMHFPPIQAVFVNRVFSGGLQDKHLTDQRRVYLVGIV